jgi:ABC-type polar amino acid transport system ATPase subunit
VIIELKNVCKSLSGKPILRDVSLGIEQGEAVVLCGPSGAGKSTLLRAISGIEAIDSGVLRVDGTELPRTGEARGLRGKVGMIFQHFNLFSHLSALENITLAPRKVLGEARASAERRAHALLERLGLADKGAHLPEQLSGGEKQRVAMARCLAMKPKIMLFDEPTSALDSARRNDVAELITSIRDTNVTMVIVTHDREFAALVGDRELAIENGQIHVASNTCCRPLRHRTTGERDRVPHGLFNEAAAA